MGEYSSRFSPPISSISNFLPSLDLPLSSVLAPIIEVTFLFFLAQVRLEGLSSLSFLTSLSPNRYFFLPVGTFYLSPPSFFSLSHFFVFLPPPFFVMTLVVTPVGPRSFSPKQILTFFALLFCFPGEDYSTSIFSFRLSLSRLLRRR